MPITPAPARTVATPCGNRGNVPATLTLTPIAPDGSRWYLTGPAPMLRVECDGCGEQWETVAEHYVPEPCDCGCHAPGILPAADCCDC
jgi:hypothetical protein